MTRRLSEVGLGRWTCIGLQEDQPGMLRLQQLGICEDRTIEVVAVGNPMIVRVERTEIGVSRQLAQCVTVAECVEETPAE